jgi:hypothetical protein
MAAETFTWRWQARGFVDDVTECGHCGRTDLKGTVRMVAVDSDGNADGDTYMGVVCAARMTGRKVAEIRTEAARADRERDRAARDAWDAWQSKHSAWKCAQRDAALGMTRFGPLPPAGTISVFYRSAEFLAAEAKWLAANPAPPRP